MSGEREAGAAAMNDAAHSSAAPATVIEQNPDPHGQPAV
jgi:hypothetical protein